MSSAGDEDVCVAGEGDLKLTEEALQSITVDISAAIAELGDIGSRTDALRGAGLADLSLTGMEAGDGASPGTSRSSASCGTGAYGA